MKLNEIGEIWNSANRLLPRSLKVWPPLISSHSFMQTLTNQKWRTVSSWLLIGLNLHEVNKVIINALTPFFGLLSSKTFATMAMWRNDFSSLLIRKYVWIFLLRPGAHNPGPVEGNPLVLVNQHDRCNIFCKISHSNPRQSWIRGLQIPYCLWNLDFGIPRAEFQIPLPDSGFHRRKSSRIP